MGESLVDEPCRSFVELLAAKEPVPGGGGAAALVGALAAALCSMVGAYTSGKRAYAAVEADVSRMLAEAERVRVRLLELVDEDAEAFEPLSRAYAIPRDDPARPETLEAAARAACVAPLETMRQVCAAIEVLEEMGEKGSRLLLSDVGCGCLLAAAALEAASLNVFVNTRTLTDRALAAEIEAEADGMLASHVVRARACADGVVAQVRG